MPAEPPPRPWTSPVSPVSVVRPYREVAPYDRGGHRGIDLRTTAGDPVRAPCGGRVTFRGRVAAGPLTLTIDCGALRATVQRVAPSVGRGDRVARGSVVGVATAAALDLSARQRDGSYRDPRGLLAGAASRWPPVFAGPRPGGARDRPGRAPSPGRPANLPAGALVAPAGSGAVPGAPSRPGHRRAELRATDLPGRIPSAAAAARADRPLLVAGVIAMLVALMAAVAGPMTRPRRRRSGSTAGRRALLVGVRR